MNLEDKLIRFIYSIFYNLLLYKLRLIKNSRKIRVGFWVTDASKWTCQHFYEELENDNNFEPFILMSYYKNPQEGEDAKEHYLKSKSYFENKGMKVYDTFDYENFKFKKLSIFKPDIIFYQQPWQIVSKQRPEKTFIHSLLCYIPYCFYSMDSIVNYLPKFHGRMWKYFVETDMHKKEYEKKYGAKNCIVSGSVKLDAYKYLNKIESIWKTKDKKRIIYSPHHSFNDGIHDVATFRENGEFILELAKSHPKTEWVFRPHPLFRSRIIKNNIMTEKEIDNYYKEWESIGTIYTENNYYELFSSSDLLITDCISFLAEYAPTLKPVMHLRKNDMKEDFNTLVKEIDKSYYQIYSNDELEDIFNRVVIQNDDYLRDQRQNNSKLLPMETSASKNIYEFLKQELKIKS